MGKFNDWAKVTVAGAVAGSMVMTDLVHDGEAFSRRIDPSRVLVMAPPAARLSHTDPELPQQPGSLWGPAIAGSTSTATAHTFSWIPKA